MEHSPGRRLDCRMNRQRHAAILGCGEDAIVREVAMRAARYREGRDESALATVLSRAFKLARSLFRVAEREMCDRNQPPSGVTAEISNPAIVSAAIGAR